MGLRGSWHGGGLLCLHCHVRRLKKAPPCSRPPTVRETIMSIPFLRGRAAPQGAPRGACACSASPGGGGVPSCAWLLPPTAPPSAVGFVVLCVQRKCVRAVSLPRASASSCGSWPLCVCARVCVICTIYEVDPYAAMRWQVYSAQSAVASLRL